jgi:threonine dehydratase
LIAVLDNPARFAGRKVGIVISGGNIDSRILAQVLMRGLVYEGRIVRLRIGITDAPGALARVTRLLGEAGANIVEVYHQRLFHNVPVKMAEVDVVLETRDQSHVQALMVRMRDAGFPTALMTDVS